MARRFSVEAIFKAVDRVTAPVTRMQNRVSKLTRSMANGMRRVNKSLDKLIGGLKSGAGAIVKFGAIGIGAITASVGLLIKEFSKVENAEAAFTPLLGGVKKAKELVDELNKTAASTPFQFETLSATASQLLPVMDGDIQNVIKTIRLLGDTAGGNAQKLDSITRGFTKAMLKGKVDMESLNMIAEAGVPIFGDLADVMGVEVNAAFFKMISAGKVTTTQLTKAFEKMTGKGGKFFKGMDIASKTTTGLWSTLKDNISLTAAELGSVLAPVVKDLIRGATDIAKAVRAWVTNNRELIASKFLKFVEAAKRDIGDFIDTLKRLNSEGSLLERLGVIITGISSAFTFLGEHGKTILKIIAGIVALSIVLKTLTGILTLVNLVMAANPITLIVLGVLALIAAFTTLVVWIDDIAAGFDKLPGIVQAILAPIGLLIKAIKFIKDNIGVISDVADAVGPGISSGLARTAEAFGFGGGAEPQMVSPQERVARSIEEKRSTSTAEVTIKDDTGRAEITSGSLGSGVKLAPSGSF